PLGRHAVRLRPTDRRAPRRSHDGNAAALGAANGSARHPCPGVAVALRCSAAQLTTARSTWRGSARGLFCRCNLFDLRVFNLGRIALLMGLVQEPADDACTLLFLGPRLVRLLLLGEEFVIDFPTHWVPPSVDGTISVTTRR